MLINPNNTEGLKWIFFILNEKFNNLVLLMLFALMKYRGICVGPICCNVKYVEAHFMRLKISNQLAKT